MNAPRCPRCRVDLVVVSKPGTTTYSCGKCAGRAVTLASLKSFAPPERVRAAWNQAWNGPEEGAACPFCSRKMRTATLDEGGSPLVLDGCRGCETIWFDAGELARFSPQRQEAPPKETDLPEDAKRALARAIVEESALTAREEHRAGFVRGALRSDHAWLTDALLKIIGL